MRFSQQVFVLAVCSLGLVLSTPSASAQQTSVPVPFHRQEHPLSCEIATLKMALGSHKIVVAEDTLIAQLPFDPTPKRAGIWGDPHRGFVGTIDGLMPASGYGVYWEPIAKLGARYAHTSIFRHGSATDLAKHITAGNPVIIWGYYGRPASYFWRTPAGTPIQAVAGEHTRVVYGFDGPVSSPTRFYLMDPLFGRMTWSTAELMANWSSFDHTGVVVARPLRWVRVPGETQVWEISSDRKTRRWVTSLAVLQQRGGSSDRITRIDAATLSTYSMAAPLE